LAFELAVAKALRNELKLDWHEPSSGAIKTAADKYGAIPVELRELMDAAAIRIATSHWIQGHLASPSSVGLGGDPRVGDVSDLKVYSEHGNLIKGISLKWNSIEIKSLRFGNDWTGRHFGFSVRDDWYRNVNTWFANRPAKTYQEAKDLYGGRFLVYGGIFKMVVDEFEAIARTPAHLALFDRFVFGTVPHLKVITECSGEKVNISAADYPVTRLNGRLKLDVVDSYHANFMFPDTGWLLPCRMHNKDGGFTIDNLSVSWTVRGWGGNKPLVVIP
jgi:hypothetical protein